MMSPPFTFAVGIAESKSSNLCGNRAYGKSLVSKGSLVSCMYCALKLKERLSVLCSRPQDCRKASLRVLCFWLPEIQLLGKQKKVLPSRHLQHGGKEVFLWLPPASWKGLTNSQGEKRCKCLKHYENTKHQAPQDGTPRRASAPPQVL